MPLIVVSIVAIYVTYKARIIFYDDLLIIKYGMSRREIGYQEVTEINIPGKFWSSLGLSSDTIEVKYWNKKVSFAPKDKDAILELLKERCPQAKVTIRKK
jgi:hypothetical protein